MFPHVYFPVICVHIQRGGMCVHIARGAMAASAEPREQIENINTRTENLLW